MFGKGSYTLTKFLLPVCFTWNYFTPCEWQLETHNKEAVLALGRTMKEAKSLFITPLFLLQLSLLPLSSRFPVTHSCYHVY